MLTIWDQAAKSFDITLLKTGKGVSTARESRGGFGNIITVITQHLSIDDVQTRFVEIKRAGNLRCRSLKLFFDGKIPESVLLEKGLKQKGPTFQLPHEGIYMCAVPFGPNEWCFMIEKRTGHGVPLRALSFIPLMDHQLQLEVDVS
ncbi:hypothetical protein [Bacillus sp. FJAT-29937]|uniref:hypothetical protein n=1 Tax=Bacillus sp. FJAT-29937 TaxID=1720553 RepID=UPI001E31314A|nr:hypothetical protein [Bacillus sp. FJAT-29937]